MIQCEMYATKNSLMWDCSAAAAAAKSLQSWLTLCDPIDGSPLHSSVPGILQARTLEWADTNIGGQFIYLTTCVLIVKELLKGMPYLEWSEWSWVLSLNTL